MIIQIPLLFAAFDPRTMSINNVLYVAVMLLLAILFIWFPGITVNGLLRIRGDQIAGAGGGRLAFRTGVALLGLYYCFQAISGLALTLIFLNVVNEMGWKETYATDPKRAIVGYAIQLALGAFCLMRPSLVERLVDIGLNHDHPGSDTRSTTAEAETN